MLRFAYNTNGCSNHKLGDAIELIAEAGYQGVALSLGHPHFDPFADNFEAAAEALSRQLVSLDLALVVETGAPYLLDPRERQEPTLLHPDADERTRRLDFLSRAITVAKICNAETVSLFAGRRRRGVSLQDAGAFLLDGLAKVSDRAAEAGVGVALKPTPGHMVATLDDFELVRDAMKQMTGSPLHLALDTGHCLATNDRDPAPAIKTFAPVLAAVSIEDMRRGIDEGLALGTGDLDLPAVLTTLEDIGYAPLVAVELPREAHRAHRAMTDAMDMLQESLPSD